MLDNNLIHNIGIANDDNLLLYDCSEWLGLTNENNINTISEDKPNLIINLKTKLIIKSGPRAYVLGTKLNNNKIIWGTKKQWNL